MWGAERCGAAVGATMGATVAAVVAVVLRMGIEQLPDELLRVRCKREKGTVCMSRVGWSLQSAARRACASRAVCVRWGDS